MVLEVILVFLGVVLVVLEVTGPQVALTQVDATVPSLTGVDPLRRTLKRSFVPSYLTSSPPAKGQLMRSAGWAGQEDGLQDPS